MLNLAGRHILAMERDVARGHVEPLAVFLHGVFITAVEGGIGYWCSGSNYRWSTGVEPLLDNMDYEGFRIDLVDSMDGKTYRVDLASMRKGMESILDGSCTCGGRDGGWEGGYIWKALKNRSCGALDAGHADIVLQAGILGDVRYG